MTSFWSMWIIVLTSATFVGITWILFANRKRHEQTTEETTGHSADGIEEFDNPLPAWWFYMFLITIVVVTWPRFPKEVVPGFLSGISSVYKKHIKTKKDS